MKQRIPLPKQVEKVHKDASMYDRKRDKKIPLEEGTDMSNMDKLNKLAEIEGKSKEQLLEDAVMDSACMGICTEPGCNYTREVEPDQDKGYCEACGKNTVASSLVLAGII
jgi:hypothetical protein